MARDRGPTVFLIFALLAAAAAFLMIRHELAAVALALALGFVLYPLHARLKKILRKDWAAAGTVLLLVTLVGLAPFVLLAFMFVGEATRFVAGLESRQDVHSAVADLLSRMGLPESRVDEWGARIVQEAAKYLQEQAVPIASFATSFILSLLVFFILLFYILIDGPRLVAYIQRVLPAPDEQVGELLQQVGDRVKAILMGTIAVGIIQGVLAGIGWWILGLPAPVFWGFVMLVLSVIPLIGAFIVLIPASIWAFANGDIFAGVGLLVLNFILVGLVDDVLRPVLIGKRAGVHPGLVLLGIVGGLPLFGISGLIVGPLLMGLLAPLFEAWARPAAHPA